MTPQTFQTIAKAVHKDMATMREWSFAKMVSGGQLVASEMDHFEDLEVLSKIGASGDEVSNCLRDLGRHLAQVINHQGVAAYATKPLGTTCLCVALCKLGTHHANSRFVSHPSSFPDAGHRPVVMGSRSKTWGTFNELGTFPEPGRGGYHTDLPWRSGAFHFGCTRAESLLRAGGDLGARCWAFTRGGLCLDGGTLTQCCTSCGQGGNISCRR
jgi:hypothetical protein